VAKTVVVPYIAGMLHRHLQLLKRVAETEEWRKYLPAEPANPAVGAVKSGPGDPSAMQL
jgi:hypothetical protein